jgi:UDP-N-acetylmuramate--alanine ligase
VHFIGIGGSGMSGIARILIGMGHSVTGSDLRDSSNVASLRELGAKIYIGHDQSNLGNPDTVVVTSALWPTNPEYLLAKEKGIPVIHRSQALAKLASSKTLIAVAGAHGKTTSTGMIITALMAMGQDPSFVNGGVINSVGQSSSSGSGELFVIEADESDGSFLAYKPTGAIITNVELDHVDHFADEEAVFAVFEDFISSIKDGGFLVACGDDSGVKTLLSRIKRSDLKVYLYGKGSSNDFRIDQINLAPNSSRATITVTGRKVGELNLSVVGEHNLLNALAAFAAATAMGGTEEKLLAGLKAFTGTRRRFELKGEVGGVKVIDDYGHHPTEITVTLKAARNLVGTGRVFVIFQPHRYSRTAAFANQFSSSLALADFTYLLEVYAASEKPISGVSSLLIAREMKSEQVKFEPSMLQVVSDVAGMAKSGDLILTLGAGDVSSLGDPILQALASRFA